MKPRSTGTQAERDLIRSKVIAAYTTMEEDVTTILTVLGSLNPLPNPDLGAIMTQFLQEATPLKQDILHTIDTEDWKVVGNKSILLFIILVQCSHALNQAVAYCRRRGIVILELKSTSKGWN